MTDDEYDKMQDCLLTLRVMTDIDRDDLEVAGVAPPNVDTLPSWIAFRENPWRFFLLCPPHIQVRIWEIVDQRKYQARLHATPAPTFKCNICHDGDVMVDGHSDKCPACGLNPEIPF